MYLIIAGKLAMRVPIASSSLEIFALTPVLRTKKLFKCAFF